MPEDTPSNGLKIWLHGCTGRMGREIQNAILGKKDSFILVGGSGHKFIGEFFYQGQRVTQEKLAQGLTRAELIIDFSSPEGNEHLLEAIKSGELAGKAILIGTTGISPETMVRWKALAEAHQLRILTAPNTSLGVFLVTKACLMIAKAFRNQNFDIEIIEAHHRNKIDSPSGTAKFIAKAIADQEGLTPVYQRSGLREKGELGVFALRGGQVFGEHTIRFMGDFEDIAVSHTALSRELFARGALELSRWLSHQKPGFYGVLDIDVANFNAG